MCYLLEVTSSFGLEFRQHLDCVNYYHFYLTFRGLGSAGFTLMSHYCEPKDSTQFYASILDIETEFFRLFMCFVISSGGYFKNYILDCRV